MQADSVKDKIVIAATKFFSHFGFHKTTMEEIARKIHKAKGALYYYFKSKEDLYKAVVKKELFLIQMKLSEIVNSDNNPGEILEIYVKTRLKLLNEANNYHETVKADFIERYSFVDDVRKEFEEFERAQLIKILLKGEQEGFFEFSDLSSTANLILFLLKSIEIPLFLDDRYEEYHQTIDEMITIFSAGLKRT